VGGVFHVNHRNERIVDFVVYYGVHSDCYRIFGQNFLWRDIEADCSQVAFHQRVHAGDDEKHARSSCAR